MKKLVKLWSLAIILVALVWSLYSLNKNDAVYVSHEFGVSLKSGANSTPITFAILDINEDGKIVQRQFITEQYFTLMMLGRMDSYANNQGINLLEQHEISGCPTDRFYDYEPYSPKCDPIDDLWKLRYARYPGQKGSKTDSTNGGWATGALAPSKAQQEILMSYGFEGYSGYVYGENLFKLLKDMTDPEWVSVYRGGK